MANKRHVILGAGTAGLNAIRTLRQMGDNGEITLVSAERPYSRMVLPYYLDETTLSEIGMSIDDTVTLQVADISLRSALRLMVKQLDLTYEIRNEVVYITVPTYDFLGGGALNNGFKMFPGFETSK